jgi:RimJ/RimL family protein N-acetyltransferase
MDIPVIETDRLILRAHRREDFEFYVRMMSDPAVVRFLGDGKPFNRYLAWLRFLRSAGSWQLLGFGYWALEERASGAFIGEAGFVDLKRDAPLRDMTEVGWLLAPSAMGRGFATEAAQAVLAWGRGSFGAKRILCVIHPDNRPSIRVAEKCGFKEVMNLDRAVLPRLVFDRIL